MPCYLRVLGFVGALGESFQYTDPSSCGCPVAPGTVAAKARVGLTRAFFNME